MANRQWQGNRGRRSLEGDEDDDDDEEEGESSIPSSSGRERSSTATGHDGKKGSIGPPPTYDGSREPGVFEEYRIRARLLYMGGFLKWGYPQIIKNYRWSFHEINHPFCVPPFSETPILFLG